MPPPTVLRVVRLATIVVVLAAIVTAAADVIARGTFDATRFFAFFTIQSNLIGVATFAWLVVAGDGARPPGLDRLRGAATLYLTITFFVVIFLLSGVDVQLELVWVDVVLHKVFPIVIVLDWLLDPPRIRLTARDVGLWLVYPIVWAVLTVSRGALDGWYPYPFLDPAKSGGYGAVAITVAAITVGFIAVGAVVMAVGNARARRTDRPVG
jgi:hypothetical protein